MKNKLIFFSLFLVIISSCKKEASTKQDISIDIISPLPNQVFKFGDTVKVIANVNSTEELHGYSLIIKKLGGGQVKNNYDHEHGTSLTINKFWVSNITTTTEMIADITVELDHDGSTTTKSVLFKCIP